MNVAQFVFFDQSSTENISNPFSNANNGSALTLQVDDLGSGGSVDISVEGAADLNLPDNYFPLKVISLENFKTTKTITSPGIYMVVIDGIGKIRLQCNSVSSLGSFKAYAISIT